MEEQITRALREAEAGKLVSEPCREHQIIESTFYRWKKKYGSSGGRTPRVVSAGGTSTAPRPTALERQRIGDVAPAGAQPPTL